MWQLHWAKLLFYWSQWESCHQLLMEAEYCPDVFLARQFHSSQKFCGKMGQSLGLKYSSTSTMKGFRYLWTFFPHWGAETGVAVLAEGFGGHPADPVWGALGRHLSTAWSCRGAAERNQLVWTPLGDPEPQRGQGWAGLLIWGEQSSEGTQGRSRTLRGHGEGAELTGDRGSGEPLPCSSHTPLEKPLRSISLWPHSPESWPWQGREGLPQQISLISPSWKKNWVNMNSCCNSALKEIAKRR